MGSFAANCDKVGRTAKRWKPALSQLRFESDAIALDGGKPPILRLLKIGQRGAGHALALLGLEPCNRIAGFGPDRDPTIATNPVHRAHVNALAGVCVASDFPRIFQKSMQLVELGVSDSLAGSR